MVHRIAIWTAICACHQLATCVVQFSQEESPVAGICHLRRSGGQVDVKYLIRDWLCHPVGQ